MFDVDGIMSAKRKVKGVIKSSFMSGPLWMLPHPNHIHPLTVPALSQFQVSSRP